jgi:hypothetical protein
VAPVNGNASSPDSPKDSLPDPSKAKVDDEVSPYTGNADFRIAGLWVLLILSPFLCLPSDVIAPLPQPDAGERVRELSGRIAELKKVGSVDGDVEGRVLSDRTVYLLACVDKFAQEAHEVLTSKAKAYFIGGISCLVATLGTLHLAGLLAMNTYQITFASLNNSKWPTHFVVIRVFSSLALAAAVYAVVKTFLSYSSAFFHEATRLLDRRHALRFGRLYMYLRREEYSFEQMEKTFEWHRETRTVFQGISATKIADSTLNQAMKTVAELSRAMRSSRAEGDGDKA